MKTKVWNKSSIIWNDGAGNRQTNIPVLEEPGQFYVLSKLSIISAPDNNTGVIKLSIKWNNWRCDSAASIAIIKKMLKNIDNSIIEVGNGPYQGNFVISYRLRKNEIFGNGAIRKAKKIFQQFCADNYNNYGLADFTVVEEKLYKVKSNWMQQKDYLRMKNRI